MVTTYGNRGKWLESAVLSTSLIYQHQGLGYVEKLATPTRQISRDKLIRVPGTFDFMGHFLGLPVAFDAKATREASLPHTNVKPHQVTALHQFSKGGGLGCLLICFERQDIGGTYLVTPQWYEQTKLELWPRVSVPSHVFKTASEDQFQTVVEVLHGDEGIPIGFGPAAKRLKALVDCQDLRNGLQKNKLGKTAPGSFPAGGPE